MPTHWTHEEVARDLPGQGTDKHMIIDIQKWLSFHSLNTTYSLWQDGCILSFLEEFILENSAIELAHRIHKTALAHAAIRNGRTQFVIKVVGDPPVQQFSFGLAGKEIENKEPLGADLTSEIKRQISVVLRHLLDALYTVKASVSFLSSSGGLSNLYKKLELVEELQRELTK
jgi:hypothetical protein